MKCVSRADAAQPSFARPKSYWRSRKMRKDPIVEEVRRVRHEHAARFNYDLKAIYRDLKEQERASGLRYVRFEPKGCRSRR